MDAQLVNIIASGSVGIAVFFGVLSLSMAVLGRRSKHLERGSFEEERLCKVRAKDPTFKTLEPWVNELSRWNNLMAKKSVQDLQKELDSSEEDSIWRADEFLASRQIEGLLLGSLLAAVCFWMTESLVLSIISIPLVSYGFCQIMVMSIKSKVSRKVQDIKRRLSFAIDLMALMMEAGAGFRDSLETVCEENQDHPLGVELSRCSQQLQRGRTISEVLQDLGSKIKDEDVNDFVYAMVKGNELGTPLSKILRSQAEQMRLRRSQWAEKDAAQAQVKIIFPGMIIMIACLLIVLGQFLLPAIFEVTGS